MIGIGFSYHKMISCVNLPYSKLIQIDSDFMWVEFSTDKAMMSVA